MSSPTRRHALGILCGAALALAACGGDAKHPENEGVDVDGDPVALLPQDGLALAHVDAKAFYATAALAPQVAQITDRLIPIGEEAGFVASRDVERIVMGVYAAQGLDAVAIVTGHFDAAKIARSVENSTITRSGAVVAESTYAGRKLFTVANVGFTVLSDKTALAGTEWGIRRTLDRIQDKRVTRGFKKWMIDTIETKGAPVAFAADFTNQPLASATIGAVEIPFLVGMKAARVVANFKEPGMHLAATLTYSDAGQAGTAADGIKAADSLAKVFGPLLSFLPQVRDLEVTTSDADVRAKFSVDDRAMKGLLGMVPALLGAK